MGKDASGTTINTSAYVGRLLESIPASYTVFKIGSDYYAECNMASGTDYGPDADPAVVMQQAVDALSNGGRIHCKGGTTYTAASRQVLLGSIYACVILDEGIVVTGEGKNTTTFKVGDGIAANFFGANTKNYIGLSDMTIDGNKANNADSSVDGNQCGMYGTALMYLTLQNLHIHNTEREGLYISNSSWAHFEDLLIHDCALTGFDCDANEKCDLINVRSYTNGEYGIDFVGGGSKTRRRITALGCSTYNNQMFGTRIIYSKGVRLLGLKSWNNGLGGGNQHGIYVYDSDDIDLIGVESSLSQQMGLLIHSCNKVSVLGGAYFNNGQVGSGGYRYGIGISDSNGCIVEGAKIYDDQGSKTQEYGFCEYGTSDYNRIISNDLRGNNTAVIYGTTPANTQIRFNIGFVTENSGITGAIATGATVTHGLAGTPTKVLVTAAESGPTDIYVSAVGATTFVINYGGGGTKTFYWQAEYKP